MLTGLPYEVTDRGIRSFLSEAKCGKILEIEMPTENTGHHKGIAFVSVDGEDNLQRLIAFSGANLNGRTVLIKQPQQAGLVKEPLRYQGQPAGCKRIFVANLSFKADEKTLRSAFADCGDIAEVRLGMDKVDPSRPAGWAHIEFAEPAAAAKAMDKNGEEIQGRSVRVDFASGNGASPSGGGRGAGPSPGGRGSPGRGARGRGASPGRGGGRTPNSVKARSQGSILVRALRNPPPR